jgi:outer membrane protein TolC
MKPSSPSTYRQNALLAAVVISSAAVTACTSALAPESEMSGTRYSEALLARAIYDGSYKGAGQDLVKTPTMVGKVTELPRVDMQGLPAAVPQTGATPATQPDGTVRDQATTLNAGSTGILEAGLRAAQLNDAENMIPLSLQDAIARGVKNSLAIKVEGYNPAIKASQIVEAEAAFDPTVFGQSNWTNTDEQTPFSTVNTNNGQLWQNQIGVKQLLPSGATAQIATGATYRDAPPNSFLSLDPSWSANVALQVTQPLFRGFGSTVNQANIYLAQRDQRISLATFRRQVITQVANIEEAYNNLVLARTNVEILERLVAASESTYQTINLRKDLDATKASISQALSALELRRADLLRARKDYRQASDKLKNLLNDPELNIRDNALIIPSDKPIAEPILYSTADCIETALRQRTELTEARLQVERADIVVNVAKNDLLPKIDLVAGVQTNGLDEGFDKAFSSTISPGNFIDYSAGIRIEFPIGNRQFEAAYLRRQNERRQAITQMMAVAQTVVADTKQQLRELLTSFEEIQIRERVRLSAADELEGIVDLEDIRARSPEFLQLILDSQARLAQAEQNLTQAIVNYNLAIMRLEQAKGTLLEFNRISLDRPPVTKEMDDVGKMRFLGQTYPWNGGK